MQKEILSFVVEKAKAMIDSNTCSQEARESAKAWLDSVGTPNESDATKKFIAELEGDIMPIDMLIAFSGSPDGEKLFGVDKAKEVLVHAKEIKAAGKKYCDCPACAAAEEILNKKAEILN